MTWYLGIDPGLHGGLALVPTNGNGAVFVSTTPIVKVSMKKRLQYAPGDMRRVLCELIAHATVSQSPDGTSEAHVVAVIEYVHALPGEGVVSVGTLMRGSGLWEGLCTGLGVPTRLVAPIAWKRFAGLLRTKKGESRVVASQMFPTVDLGPKSSTGIADALLIAAYGRSQNF